MRAHRFMALLTFKRCLRVLTRCASLTRSPTIPADVQLVQFESECSSRFHLLPSISC